MEAERLYGLALALVGDEDTAGDLVLAARDEADLRRRAAAWRGARGLQPSAEPLEPLELTPDQAEHARHLWRRRSVRRRLQRSLLAAGGVAAALLLGLGALRFAAQRPPTIADHLAGWENAEVFTGEAVAESAPAGGYRLVVFRVEAAPDSLTAYWALTGPGAGTHAGRSVDPVLARGGEPVYSSQLTTKPVGFDRLVGRSTYHVMAPNLDPVELQLIQLSGVPGNLTARAPVQRGDYGAQAPTFFFSNEVAGDGAFQVKSVTLGKEYTAVKYRLNGTTGQDSLQRVGLKVGDRWVPWRNTWMSGPYGMEGEAIFDPLPPGARSLTVHASASGFHTSVLSVTQNGSIPEGVASLGPWRRDGPTIEAALDLHDSNVILSNAGYLLDAANRRFAVILMRDAEGRLFIRGWESHAGFEPVALVTELTRFTPGLEIQIDLP